MREVTFAKIAIAWFGLMLTGIGLLIYNIVTGLHNESLWILDMGLNATWALTADKMRNLSKSFGWLDN